MALHKFIICHAARDERSKWSCSTHLLPKNIWLMPTSHHFFVLGRICGKCRGEEWVLRLRSLRSLRAA